MKVRTYLIIVIYVSFSLVVNAYSQDKKMAKKHYESGQVFAADNNPMAEKEFRLAIKLAGGYFPRAYEELAEYFYYNMEFKKAVEAYEKYIEQSKDISEVDYDILHDLQTAAKLQIKLKDNSNPSVEDLIQYSQLIKIYGGYKENQALIYAERAVNLYPESSKAHTCLGILTKDVEKSMELFLIAIELDPTDPSPHYEVGYRYHLIKRDYENAIKHYNLAIELSKEHSYYDVWDKLGDVWVKLRKYDKAKEAYENFLRLADSPKYDHEKMHAREKLGIER